MLKITCLFPVLALALFVVGCDSPTAETQPTKAQPQMDFVELKGANLLPVFVSSVSNPDDVFIERVLLKTDAAYCRANKFERQDTFPVKKARLLKAAAAVRGKTLLIRLSGSLRSQDYDQAAQAYSLDPYNSIFAGQEFYDRTIPFTLRLSVENNQKTIPAAESVARSISSVNDGLNNVVFVTSAKVVPRDVSAVHAQWDGKIDLSQFCDLRVSIINAAVFVAGPRGEMVKVCNLYLPRQGEEPKALTK